MNKEEKKIEKKLTKNWPDILVSLDKSMFISIIIIPAIGILGSVKKNKEYSKC